MTGGDGEHPRHRFRARLEELFRITGLTNERVAAAADRIAQQGRISGATRDDYGTYRGVSPKRLSDWRHPAKPAVPQRWVQLAAVLTALLERAREKAPERDELYDLATWRRLHAEALTSDRPAGGSVERAPDGPGAPRRPYAVITPAEGRPDWRMLLDGSALPPVFGLVGTLERTLVLDDVPHDTEAVLAWLARNHGRTLFLGGSRGDGRTSYVNTLAARSAGTHAFVRWPRDAPLRMQVAQDIAAEIRHAGPAEVGTVVVVHAVSGGPDDLDELAEELAAGFDGDCRTVVIVEGDDGVLERIPFYTAHRAALLPPGPESVRSWVSLLHRAHDEISRQGEDARQIAARYPNLLQFLESSLEEQTTILAEPETPMIVRLLRAVYGADMWGRLFDELRRLEPPSPDAMCYVLICLATAADRGVPTDLVEELHPQAQWELRSLGDPWICDEEGEHVARHRVIAQVVLEKAARRSNGRLIRQTVADCAAHLRTPACGTLVRRIVMAFADLAPVALEEDTERLRKAVFSGVRRGLQAVDDAGRAIEGQCGGDYRRLAEWMEVLRLLIPRQSRDDTHLWLVELHQDLLDAADRTVNPPSPEMLEYYHWKIECLRASLLGEDDHEFLDHAVRQVARFIGAAWCRADFYVDLFRWSFQAIRSRWTDTLTGPEAIDGRFLYSTLFTTYERLRSCTTEARIQKIRRDLTIVMVRHVHWQLPDDAADLIREAWETSVALDCPDPEAGTLHAELLLAGRASRPDDAAVASACRVLDTVLDAFPDHGEALFLSALAHSRHGSPADALPDRLAVPARAEGSDWDHAFRTHAAALIEPDPPRRRRLLLDAVTGYLDHIEAQRPGSYAADRLRFACDTAFVDLGAFGGSDVDQARQRHRRLASLAADG